MIRPQNSPNPYNSAKLESSPMQLLQKASNGPLLAALADCRKKNNEQIIVEHVLEGLRDQTHDSNAKKEIPNNLACSKSSWLTTARAFLYGLFIGRRKKRILKYIVHMRRRFMRIM